MQDELSPRGNKLVRLGAAVWKKSEAEFVEMAAGEYLANHKEEVDDRIREARETLRPDLDVEALMRFLEEDDNEREG